MQLALERSGDIHVVRVKEPRLTYPAVVGFFNVVGELIQQGDRKLVVDLAAVTYIDSEGIGCLMSIYRLLASHRGSLKLSGLQPRVATMLTMTGIDKVVDVHRDEPAALAAFGKQGKRKWARRLAI